MHAKIFSATTIGVDAHIVEVEVDISFGLVNFFIVGLPDAAIRESSKRIQTALKNSGFQLPAKRITVNLAPADLKKEGTLFDLPITLGILQAAEYIEMSREFMQDTLFLGELSLDGAVRFIKGALAIAYDAHKLGKKRIVLPRANAAEAALMSDVEIIGIDHITDIVAHIRGEKTIAPTMRSSIIPQRAHNSMNFSEVKGQHLAKRALTIAAAGWHNILFVGPPGSGKTMLAKRLLTIMPPLSFEEALETSKIYSVSGKLHNSPLISSRPFCNPHHSISQAGLVGGGSFPQPGEISHAHHGILFLDELTEFKRDTIESLRQPLENKVVSIARVQQSVSFPASFLLVAALNPCPCGFLGDKKRQCTCNRTQIERYLAKLSGPLLDRIDVQVNVQAVEYEAIRDTTPSESSSEHMAQQVENAIAIQRKRFANSTIYNGTMSPEMIQEHCVLTADAEELMKKAFNKLNMSMRGYHKVLKVARTIADLSATELIEAAHIREAVMYRSLDQHLEAQRT